MSAEAPAARARDIGSTVTSDSFGVADSFDSNAKLLAAAEGLADQWSVAMQSSSTMTQLPQSHHNSSPRVELEQICARGQVSWQVGARRPTCS
jgi:hypothetical protein